MTYLCGVLGGGGARVDTKVHSNCKGQIALIFLYAGKGRCQESKEDRRKMYQA